MNAATLDARYFNWLYSQVASVKARARDRTFWNLFGQLHEIIFVAIVPHDENRIADAQDLRYEFLAEKTDEQGDPRWTEAPCSFLELLIVLSRQLAFEMDDDASIWFFHLLEVLELERFNDKEFDDKAWDVVEETVERVIWRNYKPNGEGGLFPLRDPIRDQREVELWYQLNGYLMEQF